MTTLWDGGSRNRGSIPGKGKRIYLCSKAPNPALKPTQPPAEWIPAFPFSKETSQGLILITHLNLVLRVRMSGAVDPLPIYRHEVHRNFTVTKIIYLI